jgi:hypothetical protein
MDLYALVVTLTLLVVALMSDRMHLTSDAKMVVRGLLVCASLMMLARMVQMHLPRRL